MIKKFIGFLFFSLGLVFLFVPFPNSRSILDIDGKMGILKDTYYTDTEIFPMFSTNQIINVNIYANNGSFTLMVMNEDEFDNWVEHRPYSTFFLLNNLTHINKKIDVTALSSWPYLRSTIVIKPENYLIITGNLSTEYIEHQIIIALTFISIASIAFIYNFYTRHKR
ncbi:MAG: hypothetical protein P8Y70_14410 [Candidatus Lokiarchaeota archaeon]